MASSTASFDFLSPLSIIQQHIPFGATSFCPATHPAESFHRRLPSPDPTPPNLYHTVLEKISPEQFMRCLHLLRTSLHTNLDAVRGITPKPNGFVHTVFEAHNNHRALILRPDDVWTAILIQFFSRSSKCEEHHSNVPGTPSAPNTRDAGLALPRVELDSNGSPTPDAPFTRDISHLSSLSSPDSLNSSNSLSSLSSASSPDGPDKRRELDSNGPSKPVLLDKHTVWTPTALANLSCQASAQSSTLTALTNLSCPTGARCLTPTAPARLTFQTNASGVTITRTIHSGGPDKPDKSRWASIG
ncbi:uncharacterized protein F5147DRAFT_777078 [Suillus discolor]|uniref:Uncharacterized protein n=1 Tax=Suillus discolor TaxID=1912936 RepID=A0A9P7EZU3_9AGAM|nr:uncharacterized protein F5147DRAFT_777078 [Suillus discolor]KAG2100170.1 hypothetical protein F5147DRAFT_777078 [Suillus discolor]